MRYGIYNQICRRCRRPSSISYINHATSSIHPIVAKIEVVKEAAGVCITRAVYDQ